MESQTLPGAGVIPEPSLVHDETDGSTRQGGRQAAGTTTLLSARRTPLARLLAALRGDKYMVHAYPPAEAATNSAMRNAQRVIAGGHAARRLGEVSPRIGAQLTAVQ